MSKPNQDISVHKKKQKKTELEALNNTFELRTYNYEYNKKIFCVIK